MQFPDPEECRHCRCKGRIVGGERNRRRGYRRRRHECPKCGHRWTSYQTVINPKRLRPVIREKGATGGAFSTRPAAGGIV